MDILRIQISVSALIYGDACTSTCGAPYVRRKFGVIMLIWQSLPANHSHLHLLIFRPLPNFKSPKSPTHKIKTLPIFYCTVVYASHVTHATMHNLHVSIYCFLHSWYHNTVILYSTADGHSFYLFSKTI